MGPSGNPLLRFPSLCAGGPNHTIHVVFCKHFPAAVQFDQIWCPHARWERFLGIEYLDDSTNLPLPAIALHAVANTDSFDAAIERCVNCLGDADSHGAVCGQIAGAMYGWTGIGEHLKATVSQWDDDEIGLRAALLVVQGRANQK